MTSDFEVHMDEYLPLRDVVFCTLRQAILKGELKPGERLMEITLANRLGVSRTPIREAIHKLELEGLVIMVPRKGAKVASITERDLNDVLELRTGMEEIAIKLACSRMSDSEIEKLHETSERFNKLIDGNNLIELAEVDVEFHEAIYNGTNNRRLVQLMSNLREQMYRYRLEYLKDSSVRKSLSIEHEAIYQAMKERDFETAIACVCGHIEKQQKAIIKSIQGKV